MFDKIEHNAALIGKYFRNELSEIEKSRLEEWITASEDNKSMFEELIEPSQLGQKLSVFENAENRKPEVWEKLRLSINQQNGKARLLLIWLKCVAAAVLLLIVGYLIKSIFPLSNQNSNQQVEASHQLTNDVPPPNGSHAVLTLSNGQQVLLDSVANGAVASEELVNVILQNNQLVYLLSGNGNMSTAGAAVPYNTLSTKRGGFFKLQLPDKSLVWLNASSTITYPISFNSSERRIMITGEAYFEVVQSFTADGHKQSFIVDANGVHIEALGTHFNVNTYGDEGGMQATLLEGSIRVAYPELSTGVHSEAVVLTSGQQVVVEGKRLQLKNNPSIEAVMAWKNGKFVFNNSSLKSVVRQIERWYDVDIKLQNDLDWQNVTFTGRISRFDNVSKVLSLLQATGAIKYSISGRVVVINILDSK